MSERIILPDDVVEVGGFDVMVKFPSDEERPPVIVKHVRRNWAVATFEERLFKALNNEDDKKNTTSSSSKSRGGPYLLLTELAGVVIAMVDPWNNRIAHDLSSLGSYGIDSSTNLKLVVPNGDMVDIINQKNTDGIMPLAHPLDMTQSLRDDVVTESDQRELYESLAPKTEGGLYVVPQVIETE